MKSKEKELKYLIYLKSELIKQQKKELKELSRQLDELEKEKTKKRIKKYRSSKWNKKV